MLLLYYFTGLTLNIINKLKWKRDEKKIKKKVIEILVPVLLRSCRNNETAAKDICVRCEKTRRRNLYYEVTISPEKIVLQRKKSIAL